MKESAKAAAMTNSRIIPEEEEKRLLIQMLNEIDPKAN